MHWTGVQLLLRRGTTSDRRVPRVQSPQPSRASLVNHPRSRLDHLGLAPKPLGKADQRAQKKGAPPSVGRLPRAPDGCIPRTCDSHRRNVFDATPILLTPHLRTRSLCPGQPGLRDRIPFLPAIQPPLSWEENEGGRGPTAPRFDSRGQRKSLTLEVRILDQVEIPSSTLQNLLELRHIREGTIPATPSLHRSGISAHVGNLMLYL